VGSSPTRPTIRTALFRRPISSLPTLQRVTDEKSTGVVASNVARICGSLQAVSGSSAGRRARGGIERLPSGALRVRVYAGIDPLTQRRHYLREVVPPGPKAAAEAERVRTRLLNEVDEQRNPRTRATVNQLMDRYLGVIDVEPSTRAPYERYIIRYIRPQLGALKVGRVDAEVLDSFYARLRTCRDDCRGARNLVDHRTPLDHECRIVKHRRRAKHDCMGLGCRVIECPPHSCKPLAPATIRQIHWILSGAFSRAVRWRWVSKNPMEQAEVPAAPTPNPDPPTAEEAARLLTEAWQDPDWGTLVWLAMTTGARRGELSGLRWSRVDLASATVVLRKSRGQVSAKQWEKDTKTHQQRRVALDSDTIEAMTEHRGRCEARAQSVGVELTPDAYVFSLAPDGSTPIAPDTITQRYGRMAARLGIDTHLHALRHYSATELVSAGVDIRTVAGRLGHAGGGATTLRVYAAWVSEADQRAAAALGPRMPTRPRRSS
jgi:integrase